ncbi:MAG TPA: PEGA domain-containing protein [Polyangium sp.]|nr:PEGA domain-containing protein [Polyangium sp.]
MTKRQYGVDSNPANLRKALESYRRFLTEDKTGKRRGDASQSIMEIEAVLSRLPAEQQGAPSSTALPPEPTQLSVTTQVDDAVVSIDGAAARSLDPVEVTPGKHKIVLNASGYFPEEREVFAREKQMTAIDVQLRPMPAKVRVVGREGSTVTVDGLPRGTLPMPTPLEIDAGDRSIAVSQNGFTTYAHEYKLERGKEIKVTADLSRTRQRIASYFLFGTGLVIAGSGILLALGAADAQDRALAINALRNDDTRPNGGSISYEQLVEYKKQSDLKSQFTVSSSVALNLGAATGALGFLLYYFDAPKIPSVKPKKDDNAPAKKDQSPGLRDMMFAPMTGPGFAGASFSAKF